MKKYELVCDSSTSTSGRVFHRIRALRDFGKVKKGEIGGYVESEKNLSHDGLCWVRDSAVVGNYAQVIGDAEVCKNAFLSGCVIVRDNATVSDYGRVMGTAVVCDRSKVLEHARVYGDNILRDDSIIQGYATIGGNAVIESNASVCGDAFILGDALIRSNFDYATISGFGHEGRHTTFFRLSNGDIGVKCGCFYGTLGEFRKKVKETHGNTHYATEYLMIADLMKKHFIRESKSLKYSFPFIPFI